MTWELVITRTRTEKRKSTVRTIGSYEVHHDGAAIDTRAQGAWATGQSVETHGPGDNTISGTRDHDRLEAGTYPLWTHGSPRYATFGYAQEHESLVIYDYWERPHPCLGIEGTGYRAGCLIHPGIGFLASIGCINLSDVLPGPDHDMDYTESWHRVVSVIDDVKSFLTSRTTSFPHVNNQPIPGATLTIIGEP